MARPRLPSNVAKITGAARKNPARFQNRNTTEGPPLGEAPNYLHPPEVIIWDEFASDMPWLARSDRRLVEVAVRLSAQLESDPAFPMSGFAQLRLCLASMGGTPSDRTKMPQLAEDLSDLSEFFN